MAANARNRKSYHVMPHPDGGWAVKTTGAHRAMKVFGSKKDATACAKVHARNKVGARYVIHGRDGVVQREGTIVERPAPTRGRTQKSSVTVTGAASGRNRT